MITLGTLQFKSLNENHNLVSDSIIKLAQSLEEDMRPLVAEIDPKYMGGKELCEHYGVNPEDGANCVIIEAKKNNGLENESLEFVAIVVPVGNRADLNGFIRKYLGARRVSLAPLDKVIEETGMEYGSITPFGLPTTWKILIDELLMNKDQIIIGGGKQVSKLLVKTAVFKGLPNVEIIKDLSKKI